MAGDWKTIDQRQRHQRRNRMFQDVGIATAVQGAGLALRGRSTMGFGALGRSRAKIITAPLKRGFGHAPNMPPVKYGAKQRAKMSWGRAKQIPGGRMYLGGGAAVVAGAGVYTPARGLEAYHQHKINGRRRNGPNRTQLTRVTKSATWGANSARGSRFRGEEIERAPVSKLQYVPTNVIRNQQKLTGPIAPAQPGQPNQPGQQGPPGQVGANNGPGQAAGAAAPQAGKATATPMGSSSAAKPQAAVSGMGVNNKLKPVTGASTLNKAAPRRFDPEDRRQRRIGMYTGGLATGGGLEVARHAKPLASKAKKLKMQAIPLNRHTRGVAVGTAALGAAAATYRHGNSVTNRRWQ
jgi:hypothetical protein